MDYSLLILINPKILLPSSRIKLQINIDFSYRKYNEERNNQRERGEQRP
jgi:hypothetical protein